MQCGHDERNLFYRLADLPDVKECAQCGARASEQVFDQFGAAQIHESISTLYGHWHPQAGEVIRDRAHKHELMKKYGWIEAGDPVKGNRKLSEEVDDGDGRPEPTGGGTTWMDPGEARQYVDDVRKGKVKLKPDDIVTPEE